MQTRVTLLTLWLKKKLTGLEKKNKKSKNKQNTSKRNSQGEEKKDKTDHYF